MKCPYSVDIKQVNQNRYEYNDDGLTTFHEHILIETRTFMECPKEQCGAWQDGKCKYSG